MTARPNFPGGRGRPVFVAVALCIVLIAVVLTAGCNEWRPDRDIVVTKVTTNGSLEWVTVIDTGHDEMGDQIIQINDNQYIGKGIGMGLFQLSPKGSLNWVKNYSYYGICSPFSMIPSNTGGFDSISYRGELCRFNSQGIVIGNHSTGLSACRSIKRLEPHGYVITGMNDTYIPFNSTDIENIYSKKTLMDWIRHCANTTPQTNTSCKWEGRTKNTPFTAILDPDGKVVSYSEPDNSSIIENKTEPELLRKFLGLSVEFVYEKNGQRNIPDGTGSWVPYVVKQDVKSSLLWKTRIDLSGHPELIGHHWETEKIIPTSDGGYVILADVDKSRK